MPEGQRGTSERRTHASARRVGEIANRIEVLPSRSRCDQDATTGGGESVCHVGRPNSS
ncbi:hypothetical protein RISK_004696 [Rhodopirellula islandica]|uniref:Uncharacterized protein n=1 Tax=Rhodopirellula islandica TaxID=595434 RepID=A0A0J1ECZ9_RHOIS|nr:hypothetical protein RISK_004696 [Rhodopirellula islandica]